MNFNVLYVIGDDDPVTPDHIAAAASSGLDVLLDLDVCQPPDRYEAILSDYLAIGVRGIRLGSAWTLPVSILQRIIAIIHASGPSAFCCGDAFGQPEATLLRLANAGLDYVFNSSQWWDGRAAWFLEQRSALHRVTRDIGFPSSSAEEVDKASLQRGYLLAAALSDGIMMPGGYEFGFTATPSLDIAKFIAAINLLKTSVPALAEGGAIRAMAEPFQAVQGFARRSIDGRDLAFILTNTDPKTPYAIDLDWLLGSTLEMTDLEEVTPGAADDALDQPKIVLDPGTTRIFRAHPCGQSEGPHVDLMAAGRAEIQERPSHLIIETVEPEIDGGRFAIKRIVGDELHVSADIFRDGHDQIAAAIRLKEAGETEWRAAPMQLVENDRWAGSITVKRSGRARYTIEAWTDRFQSWRLDTLKKRAASQSLTTDLAEAEMMVAEALERSRQAGGGRGERRLTAILKSLEQAADETARADILLAEFTRHAVGCFPDKSDQRFYGPWLDLVVDREAARFAAWYEMFPRSQGTVEGKGATFADCTARLPEIQALGFDVLYLVPINPIGQVNRKGRHNSLTAGPDEPGSPYAIGNETGGHDAVEQALGTLEDFRVFHRAVQDHGMELALDFAVQCAPDHPWVKEHPTWFRRRPDGTIKFAENPPKKYEDIVNLDFDCAEWKDIWHALRDVVLFWVDEGVRIFRIDNPHTKPVPFWEWLISEVKQHDPAVLFLAEAFTRPKMMKRLAKIGFTQSYSYFTWRNTKTELTEYLAELTQGPSRDYMQPNFFANTPDILPFFLQTGGRAGFRIRLALAATLSPVYGIYNGFELCEAAALPGREEYADSEKYTYKVWDWDRPGNIKDDIQRINRLRRESQALRLFTNLIFAEASSPQVLFYAKISADRRDVVLIAINLDPFTVARTDLSFPFDAMGLDAEGSFETEELFTGERRLWQGQHHTIVLDPAVQPTMILRRVGVFGEVLNANA